MITQMTKKNMINHLLNTTQVMQSLSVEDSTGSSIQFSARFWRVTHDMLVRISLDAAFDKLRKLSVFCTVLTLSGLKHI